MMLAPCPALELLLWLILAPARTPRHHSRKPMRVVLRPQKSYRVNPTFGHLALFLTFLAALTSPTDGYSQDDFRPLPAERWEVSTTSAVGAPYLSANDYSLGNKPVLWQCATDSDRVKYEIKDIEDILVVMAHQPDFPQRMDFFSSINAIYSKTIYNNSLKWARIDPIPIFIDDQREKRFLYGGSVHTVNNDSIYASLLVYVHIKFENYGNYFLAPLVAYYSGTNKSLEDLQYYAPDCDAANLNGLSDAYHNLAVVPPLGRADDYPAFRIAVPDDDDGYYIEAWKKVQQALGPWSGALEGKLEISSDHAITKLLLHIIRSNDRPTIPTVPFDGNGKDSWTYGDLLRHYFDYHDANGDRVNPVFLSDLDFPVKIEALRGRYTTKPWFISNTVAPASRKVVPTTKIVDTEPQQEFIDQQQPEVDLSPSIPATGTTHQISKAPDQQSAPESFTISFAGVAFAGLASQDISISANRACSLSASGAGSYNSACDANDVAVTLQHADESWVVHDGPASGSGDIVIDAAELYLPTGSISFVYQNAESWQQVPDLPRNLADSLNASGNISPHTLATIVGRSISLGGCSPIKLKLSQLISREIIIDFPACEVSVDIIVVYPEQYQPANTQDMQVSTTFTQCTNRNAAHIGQLTSDTQGWQFSSCLLGADNADTFPLQIDIIGFEPVDQELAITPLDTNSQAGEIILSLNERQLAASLRPQLVASATQPFGSDLNPIPDYRLSDVSYRRSTSDSNETCGLYAVSVDGDELILPSLAQANCESLPTHISYYYERLNSTDSSFPSEAYRSTWRTNYFPLLQSDFIYSHDQFKRRALFSSARLRQQIDFLQSTPLGAQYDENNNLDGNWAYFIHADYDCDQFIGFINSDAYFITTSTDDDDARWPLYAQIYNIVDPTSSLSNCAPAQFEAIPEDDRTGMVSFDLFLTIPR